MEYVASREALAEPLVSQKFSQVEQPSRRCRDVPWLLLFVGYWLGMLWVAACSLTEGDLGRLHAGLDDENHLCGTSREGVYDLEARPFLYFSCLQYGARRPTVCMTQCPVLSGHYVRWYNGTMISCDAHGRSIPATTYPSTNLGRSCVPAEATLYVLVANIIDDSAFTSVISGMLFAVPGIVAAAASAALLAFAWIRSVRWLADAALLVPVTVAMAALALAFISATLWLRASYLTSDAFAEYSPVLQGSLQVAFNTDMSVVLAMFTSACSIGVILALCLCGFLHRLLQAGGILREAAEACAAMPSLVLVLPPLVLALLSLLFAYWLWIALLLASAGEPSHGHMRYDRRLQWFFVYHSVGLLWSAEVILHLGFCVASGAVARWYFASPETLPPNCGADVVRNSIVSTLRYSPGSLALGALLLIPGRVFRFFLEHCLHLAQTDGHSGLTPDLRRLAKCCTHCCLDCSTRYVHAISHNAYILVAVHDTSFCEGARQAFELTMRNVGQVAVLTAGERLLLSLAKVAISCVCTAFAALAMSTQMGDWGALDNANGALIFIFIVTFCTADAWIGMYDAAVEAIFLCYLVDQEENDGDTRPFYASAALRNYMERHRPCYQLPEVTTPETVSPHPECPGELDGDGARAVEESQVLDVQ